MKIQTTYQLEPGDTIYLVTETGAIKTIQLAKKHSMALHLQWKNSKLTCKQKSQNLLINKVYFISFYDIIKL